MFGGKITCDICKQKTNKREIKDICPKCYEAIINSLPPLQKAWQGMEEKDKEIVNNQNNIGQGKVDLSQYLDLTNKTQKWEIK